MTDLDHRVVGRDEELHPPEGERLWQESWYLDLAAPDGSFGGYVRLGRYPDLGTSWWTTAFVIAGRDPVMSIDFAAPVRAEALSLAVQTDDLHATIATPEPLRRSTVTLAATGRRAPPASLLDPRGYASGVEVAIAADLTWDAAGEPFAYGITTRYEIPCRVSGRVRIGDEEFEVECPGQRDHSWGVRDWWAFGWCWLAAQLEDGTALHLTHVRLSPDSSTAIGYVQSGVPRVTHPVSEGFVEEELGVDGLPVAATAGFGVHAVDLHITPLLYAPLVFTDRGRVTHFPRALAEFTLSDGRAGVGWIEWNRPVVADL